MQKSKNKWHKVWLIKDTDWDTGLLALVSGLQNCKILPGLTGTIGMIYQGLKHRAHRGGTEGRKGFLRFLNNRIGRIAGGRIWV